MILFCSAQQKVVNRMKISKESYGKTHDGVDLYLYKIKNSNGLEVHISNYGATILSIFTPDKNDNLNDIVLGFDSLDDYQSDRNPYFGATCGRYANRIKDGKFSIGNNVFYLPKNDNCNSLHGGIDGFDKKIWNHEINDNIVIMTRVSPDGEEGYPGNLTIKVYFSLTELNELVIKYKASTDKSTVVNLTNHSYFNLSGKDNILDHLLKINADQYTDVDDLAIPTGKLKNVKSTEMDFLTEKRIGKDINLVQGLGYDHNYCINKNNESIVLAAEVFDPLSGRTLHCITNEPGIQFYTGNFLDGLVGKKGNRYYKHSGFCLETQHFPDSPNNNHFPSTVLNPNENYFSVCIYKFGVRYQ